MKLYYYRENFNFGDALNPWLWSQLLPEILDLDDRIAFVGIGTLLNEWLAYSTPSAQQRVIFGSGVGYGNGLPRLDPTDRIYCLRGPLSARALGLDSNLAVTDSAVLLRRCFERSTPKSHRFAYMPHWQQADCDWQLICQELGWSYIDPRWSIPKILAAISQTDVLLAEAMHGAIIADALRVPWISIVTSTGVLAFKWHDWCQSVGLEYSPVLLQAPPIFSPLTDAFDRASLVDDWIGQKQAIYQLREIATTVQPQLSADRKIEDLTCELEARLAQFQTDVQRGDFLSAATRVEVIVEPPTLDSTEIKDLTQFYHHREPQKIGLLQQPEAMAQSDVNQLLDIAREIQSGGFLPSDSLSWGQLRLLQRSIATVANQNNERDRSILQQELITTQQQLSGARQELTTTQQQLSDARQESTTTQQQLSDAQTQIRSMEQTKVWKLRQAWHRIRQSN